MLKQAAFSVLFVGATGLGFAPFAQAEDATSAARRAWAGPTVAEIRGEASPRVPATRADATPNFSIERFWKGEPNYGERPGDAVRDSGTVAANTPVEFGTFLRDLYTGSGGDGAGASIAADVKGNGSAAGAK